MMAGVIFLCGGGAVLNGGADILVCPNCRVRDIPVPPRQFASTRQGRNALHTRMRADKNVCPTSKGPELRHKGALHPKTCAVLACAAVVYYILYHFVPFC